MKTKVRFLDKDLFGSYMKILGSISVITSFIFIFYTISEKKKMTFGIVFAVLMIFLYIVLWIKANYMNSINLKIKNSDVVVKIGDLFQEKGLKVIPFNEYFDTLVNEEVIASTTLNGNFVNNYITDVDKLDKEIVKNRHLVKQQLEENVNREQGKNQKYKLGSIHKHEEYLLAAFSKFDDDNRAFLTMKDYINCLLNFWNEIDIIYAGESVVIPLLGTGITRLNDCDDMSEQEKLELLLWSFKVSRVKFPYPSKVTIVIHQARKDKINFYKLKEI